MATSELPRIDVLGVKVSAISMSQAIRFIDVVIAESQRTYVCVTGVHGVMECQRDEDLLRIHNSAGLVTPDGMPLVWLGRTAGMRHMQRVYGPDLMLAMCSRSLETGYRHFFYGGGPGVAQLLAERLRQRFPGLQVVGTYTPPFRPLEQREVDELIRWVSETRPDVMWVGLSTPKQEKFMGAMVGRLPVPVMVGVGAAFDFHAGTKPQAPVWMQRSGLEWVFRMATEPRRLTLRYLRNNPAFVVLALAQQLGLKRFGVEAVSGR